MILVERMLKVRRLLEVRMVVELLKLVEEKCGREVVDCVAHCSYIQPTKAKVEQENWTISQFK